MTFKYSNGINYFKMINTFMLNLVNCKLIGGGDKLYQNLINKEIIDDNKTMKILV